MRTNYRTAVTIPERSWTRFRDILTDFIDKVGTGSGGKKDEGDHAGSAVASGGATAGQSSTGPTQSTAGGAGPPGN